MKSLLHGMSYGLMRLVVLLMILPMLAGCYEREVTRSESRYPFRMATPDTVRYGQLALYFVKEYRKPWGIFQFPDGGVPYELAVYEEVRQVLPGGDERVVGQLHQKRLQRGDFGDVLSGGREWVSENRLRRWVRHGYLMGEQRTDTVEIVIPPLP